MFTDIVIMDIKRKGDLYVQMRSNRLRLASAVALHALFTFGLSALIVYLFMRDADPSPGFWFWLSLLWLLFLLYASLRFALGGRWIFRSLVTIPPWETDIRLCEALDAARLAAGMRARVRLFCIPNADINAFSLSLPDGSFALFATSGIVEKLPERERVAIMAHEISHMLAGDAGLYTVMLRLTGRRAMRKMVKGATMSGENPLRLAGIFAFLVSLATTFFVLVSIFGGDKMVAEEFGRHYSASRADILVVFFLLFLLFATSLPPLMHKLLQLFLDRRREYNADLQAAYLTRDPESIYLAVKHAAEDVRDVMILPACFDALLFHPVADYTSYNPFGTQPTMASRMKKLRDSFPAICFGALPSMRPPSSVL